MVNPIKKLVRRHTRFFIGFTTSVSLSDLPPPSVYKSHISNGTINKLYWFEEAACRITLFGSTLYNLMKQSFVTTARGDFDFPYVVPCYDHTCGDCKLVKPWQFFTRNLLCFTLHCHVCKLELKRRLIARLTFATQPGRGGGGVTNDIFHLYLWHLMHFIKWKKIVFSHSNTYLAKPQNMTSADIHILFTLSLSSFPPLWLVTLWDPDPLPHFHGLSFPFYWLRGLCQLQAKVCARCT